MRSIPLDAGPGSIESITSFDWVNPRAAEIARELCIAVAAAEQAEGKHEFDPEQDTSLEVRAHWSRAVALAEDFRRVSDEEALPTVVSDALGRIDAAADVYLLTQAPDHAQT